MGLWYVLSAAGGVPDGAQVGEQFLALAQHVRRARPPPGGPLCLGDTLFYLGELASSESTWSRVWPSMIPSSIAPMPSAMDWTPG